ncbi:MAG: type II toxin-antitoxin system VapB family antitoxin [Steroidobacteraceae bacterium]
MTCASYPFWEIAQMKAPRTAKRKRAVSKQPSVKLMPRSVSRRASIFRNGANQAVRLPQELRFPEDVKEVRIRKQGDSLLISPVRPDWASFFSMEMDVPDDFLERRDDSAPQSREPL